MMLTGASHGLRASQNVLEVLTASHKDIYKPDL